jgi:hypothetical protein
MTVGAVADPAEAEADRIADDVVAFIRRMPMSPGPLGTAGEMSSRIRRGASRAYDESVPADPAASTESARVRRSTARSLDTGSLGVRSPGTGTGAPGRVQRRALHADTPAIGLAGGDLDAELTGRIRRASGHGAALAPEVRGPMETAFGSDFSAVRIHRDSDVAPRIGASAFTAGSDIHFAAGEYRPNDRGGQWLLSHELTHVVQQTGAEHAGGVRRRVDTCIQRHASKEHYMLGSLTPAQIKAVADAKGKVEALVPTSFSFFSSVKLPPADQLEEARHTIEQQLAGLDKWRSATVDQPDPKAVQKGNTEYSAEWGGQLVTVPCKDGEIVCTVGELNAIPDFFGSYDDMGDVDRSVVFKTLQVIRRESYMYLKTLEAQLRGKTYAYSTKTEGFAGLEGNNISIPSSAPKAADDAKDVLDTEKMLAGGVGETGLEVGRGASATLGRNACHFPPESWLRWREHHTEARRLIDAASDPEELADAANRAIGLNAFGEHYLQDSFASGHLINKGFVMAVAMEHMSASTKQIRGVTDNHIRVLQEATAHREAYDVPSAAKQKLDARESSQAAPRNILDDPTLKARDPQSALDAARGLKKANAAATSDEGKRAEMQASGISPDSMSFDQYRLWLNDFWLQKITNTLHDKYCVEGLMVASPDNTTHFRIFGDNHMMESSEGAEYTAATSQMSRDAINAMVQNKQENFESYGGYHLHVQVPSTGTRPVPSVEKILSRFPDRVIDGGTQMALKDWATGQPIRNKIAAMVASWTPNLITLAVRAVSTVKQVSSGLTSEHAPF